MMLNKQGANDAQTNRNNLTSSGTKVASPSFLQSLKSKEGTQSSPGLGKYCTVNVMERVNMLNKNNSDEHQTGSKIVHKPTKTEITHPGSPSKRRNSWNDKTSFIKGNSTETTDSVNVANNQARAITWASASSSPGTKSQRGRVIFGTRSDPTLDSYSEEDKLKKRTTTRVARLFSNEELSQLQNAIVEEDTDEQVSMIGTSNRHSVAPIMMSPSPSPASIHYHNGTSSSTKARIQTSIVTNTDRQGSSSNLSISNASLLLTPGSNGEQIRINVVSSNNFLSGMKKRVYYLLEVYRGSTKAGMILRSYKHFQVLHTKFELMFPGLSKEVSLPKQAMISDDRLSFSKELQEYLTKLVGIPEVCKSPIIHNFIDPVEAPLLVYITQPEKEGFLKLSRGLLSNLGEVWVVVKHNRLYYYEDNNQSSVPIGSIRLQYSTITIPNSSSSSSNKDLSTSSSTLKDKMSKITDKKEDNCTFSIITWGGKKDYLFKSKDDQDRNEWVNLLRSVKVRAISEVMKSLPLQGGDFNPISNSRPRKSSETSLIEKYVQQKYICDQNKSQEFFMKIRQSGELSFEDDSDKNIIFHSQKKTIKGATVEKLIEKLTEEEQDMEYVLTFLLTYRSFTTPIQLLDTCLKRFCCPPSKKVTDKQTIHPTQLRVCTVLMKWAEVNVHDFLEDDNLSHHLIMFIESELGSVGRFQVFGKKLKDLVRKKVLKEERSQNALQSAPPPDLPPLFSGTNFDIMDISSIEIARQMTLIEFDLFKAIEPKECLGQKWNKKDQKDQANHIISVIKRFNQVSQWVVTRIVTIDDLKPRASIVSKFIDIAQKCIDLNNYNTAMEIISGLNSSSVYRLNKTWESLSPAVMTTFNKLKEALSVEGNYKSLRDLLHSRQPPCIPYFGLYLTDLVFVDDGNPDKISDNGLLVNFEKLYLNHKVIKEIQLYQQTSYNYQSVDEIINNLLYLSHLDEKDAYNLSLKCEPR